MAIVNRCYNSLIQHEFDEGFDALALADVLESVPESVTAKQLAAWIADDFVPFVSRSVPKALVGRQVLVEKVSVSAA